MIRVYTNSAYEELKLLLCWHLPNGWDRFLLSPLPIPRMLQEWPQSGIVIERSSEGCSGTMWDIPVSIITVVSSKGLLLGQGEVCVWGKSEKERDWKHCCTRRLTQDPILKCCTRPTHRLGIMHASWFWVLSVYSDSLLVNICLSPCESNTRCENNGAFSSPEVNDSLGSNIVGLPQGAKTTKYACHPRHSAPSKSRHTHTGLYANCHYKSRDGASPTLETTTFIQTLLTLKPADDPIHVGLSSRHHILWDARTTSSWICIYFSQA